MSSPISQTAGYVPVFVNATANQASPDYNFPGGDLQVDVFGVLDGADVITYYRGASGQPVFIKDLSWRTSAQEVLNTTDGGIVYLARPAIILFQLSNVGALTSINLSAFQISEIE